MFQHTWFIGTTRGTSHVAPASSDVHGAVILHAKAKQQSGQLFQLASRDVPRRLCV